MFLNTELFIFAAFCNMATRGATRTNNLNNNERRLFVIRRIIVDGNISVLTKNKEFGYSF